MLTARGWWFLLVALALLGLALGSGAGTMALIAFTLLSWFSAAWCLFAVRLLRVKGRLRLERELRDDHGPVRSLWTRVPAVVRLRLHSASPAVFPFALAIDHVPALAERRGGEHFAEGLLTRDQPLEWGYRIECPAPGTLQFEGVKVHLADLHGFFVTTLFVRERRLYRVLPALADARTRVHTVKRFNMLPLLGTHGHRRPGSGSDLLDVRDYMPGDPPKMIAWKASARRDRLMTKELESEVPIRCTLFVDVSQSVRVGALGRNALARLVEIAAAVAQANVGNRDLTGLCLFDDTGVRGMMRPARGARHNLGLTHALSDAAALLPEPRAVPLEVLLPLAYGLLQDFYPELLDQEINAMPVWLPYWVGLRSLWWAWAWPYLFVRRWRQERSLWRTLARGLWRLAYFHRTYRWRKQLSAVLALRYGLGPGGLGLLLENDEACAGYIKQFLAEHQVSCPMMLYDAQGRYQFAAAGKIDVLAEAFLASVMRGRDNELFVLLVDVLELGPGLDKLLRAVKVALGRHHQVVVICPWPQGVDVPGRKDSSRPGRLTPTAASALPRAERNTPSLHEVLARAHTLHLYQAYDHARHAFSRLGVPMLCAPEDAAVNLVLRRIQQLRVLQRGVP